MERSAFVVMQTVPPYLSPVDFMHTIKASNFLYKNNRDKIPKKRKESLVRFVEHKIVENSQYIETWRGTRLPNGRYEGRVETITGWYYIVDDYINGHQMGYKFVYNYVYCGGRQAIVEEDTKLLRDDLSYKIENWQDIDISKMRLLVKHGY